MGLQRLVTPVEYIKGVTHAVISLKFMDIAGITTEHGDPVPFILEQVLRLLKGCGNPKQIKLIIEKELEKELNQ